MVWMRGHDTQYLSGEVHQESRTETNSGPKTTLRLSPPHLGSLPNTTVLSNCRLVDAYAPLLMPTQG